MSQNRLDMSGKYYRVIPQLWTELLITHCLAFSVMAKERIVPRDDRLHGLGYGERNKQKQGLYSKQLQHCIAYLDHRDIGGKSAGEQVEQGPMFYSFPMGGHATWQSNREAMLEQLMLAAAGVKYRISIVSTQPLVGEIGYQNGYCKTCGKDFQADGVFCSDACARVFGINLGARNEGIPVMRLMNDLGIE